jgi:hypothetical protein
MEPKAPDSPTPTPKPSKVEAIKLASEYLKVHMANEAFNGESHFSEDAATVLKFHGSYQQDDRDHRTLLKREGKEKAYSMMVRIRMPGGKGTAAQYLAVDEPRDHEIRPPDHDPQDQRRPALDPRRLRRRRAERPHLPGPDR